MTSEIDPSDTTFSESQTPTTRADCAFSADTTEAEVSTSQLAADHEVPSSEDSNAQLSLPFSPEDYMQWESTGSLKAPVAKRQIQFSAEGMSGFAEGSNTTNPTKDLIAAEPPPQAEGETEITPAAAEIASTDSIYPDESAAESDTDSEALSSAPSSADASKTEVNVPRMDIDQLKMHMRKLGPKWEGLQAEIATHHTALGGLEPIFSNLSFQIAETLWHAKKRIQQTSAARGRNGGWSQFLREVASDTLRKSADRMVSGYALYLESVPALQAAIRNARVSPHTEMIADRVRSLRERVVTGDLDPDAADFEATCISELRAKPPRATSRKETRRKGGNRRTVKINPPQSVEELRDICVDFVKTCPREVREANPLLVAFAQTTASTKVDDLFRPLIHKFLKTRPPEERQACALNISFIADAALDFVREELNPQTTPPERNSESSASLHVEEDTSAANADPLPDPTVASTPETTAEISTKRRHVPFLFDEVFQTPPVIGERKPPTFETLDAAVAPSDLASL